jgi:acyl-[acyl-carrier-protein]-phospholipid O-acyltransferase / long-chain-fatty-acid--[acyl-carrier-protein] ligase
LKIEDAIRASCGDEACVVVGVADLKKGERLVVLYTGSLGVEEVWRRVASSELPKLWVPKRENFYFVESLPTLGTGKLDLRGVRGMAEGLVSKTPAEAGAAS